MLTINLYYLAVYLCVAAPQLVLSTWGNSRWASPAIAYITGGWVKGKVILTQSANKTCTHIKGKITGLSPGTHGFSINEYGDLSDGCANVGEHYNPFYRLHAGPNVYYRHVGDLGNIKADADGIAVVNICSEWVRLYAWYHVIGRSIVISESEDDLGKQWNEGSRRNGNSGETVGCGVIGWQTISTT